MTAIVREALTNVRRHAGATEVSVSVRQHEGSIRLTVHDNGRGFAPHAVPTGHHGILGMRERARLLGGALRLVSRPGRGVTITVIAPAKKMPAERTP